jgi:pimeloyl-ACP methyl ester carboxylesterase
VAYDKPGCGLSDPWPAPQTLDSDLEVLRTVIDHLELGRVDLLGLSMGAPVSLAYAVQHPERVGRLMLYGGFADGHQVASAEVRAAMIELVRAHWGLGSDVLADIFLPDGTAEAKVRFAELQRRSTTAGIASELLAQCYELRVDDLLDRVATPTLSCTGATTGPFPTGWDATWRPGSPGRGWYRSPAGATGCSPATPRRWSARSWGSWAPLTARCPPTRLRGHLPGSRHGSSRSRPWSPAG